MSGLVRAEFRKLRTTQVWLWLLLASVAITALGVIAPIASAPDAAELQDRIHDVLRSAGSANIAVFVLGVLAVTTEFRYQTITPTVLATPSRWQLITAKLLTFAVVGALYALVCTVVELAIALPWLSARHVHVSLVQQDGGILSAFAIVALYALVGLGAGALLKNQIVAVSVGLIFILFLQNIVVAIPKVKVVYPFLPSGLSDSIGTAASGDRYVNGVHLMPIWAGVLGLAVWGLGMSVLGAGITMNRDIT
jgi:ABC-2 type transport system permease protein